MRLLPLLLLVTLAACIDQDPFGASTRKIAGDYSLHRSEDGQFYLHRGKTTSGGGVLEGTVELITLTNNFIFAKRIPLFAGDAPGWMTNNTQTHQITGPTTDAEFTQKNPKLKPAPPSTFF